MAMPWGVARASQIFHMDAFFFFDPGSIAEFHDDIGSGLAHQLDEHA